MNADAFHYYTRLDKVRSFVEVNYSDEISLEQAADVACMERTSSSRFFGSKAGISFTQWLRRVRIAKAQDLMRKNNLSIIEITYAVGFSNLRTFERVFKNSPIQPPRNSRRGFDPPEAEPGSLRVQNQTS